MNKELYNAVKTGDLPKVQSLTLNQKYTTEDIVRLVCAALRQTNYAVLHHILRQQPIRAYLLHGRVHTDIVDTMYSMSMYGACKQLCEFAEALWPHGARFYPDWLKKSDDVINIITHEQRDLFFTFKQVAKKLNGQKCNLPARVLSRIFDFLDNPDDQTTSITSKKLKIATLVDGYKLGF
jgi:hypothetical protein